MGEWRAYLDEAAALCVRAELVHVRRVRGVHRVVLVLVLILAEAVENADDAGLARRQNLKPASRFRARSRGGSRRRKRPAERSEHRFSLERLTRVMGAGKCVGVTGLEGVRGRAGGPRSLDLTGCFFSVKSSEAMADACGWQRVAFGRCLDCPSRFERVSKRRREPQRAKGKCGDEAKRDPSASVSRLGVLRWPVVCCSVSARARRGRSARVRPSVRFAF